MELDLTRTLLAFAAVVAVGVAALVAMPTGMSTGTILMMVLPSMVIFGAIALAIGVAHGQYRATR